MKRLNGGRLPGHHHLGDDDRTPTERPTRTLDVHKPYIRLLTALTHELEDVKRNFAALTQELVVARAPLEKAQLRTARDIFRRLEIIGHKGKEGFSK